MKGKYWALLLFVLLLAACGGGGGGGSGSAPGAQSGGTAVDVTPVTPPPPVASSKSYKLVLAGTEVPALKGLQFVLSLPPGAELRYDSSQAVLPESLGLSGQAPADAFLAAQKAAGGVTVAVVSGTGLGPGELATLTCDLAPGATPPSAGSFAVADLVAVGRDDNLLPGISVTVQ